jgi:hypothetical protein
LKKIYLIPQNLLWKHNIKEHKITANIIKLNGSEDQPLTKISGAFG